MTETCTIISIFVVNGGSLPRASAGVFAPMIEAKVVSPEGKTLGFGEVGELWTRSPSNALGYLGNQKATDETWDADGFVHTGDEVYVCPEGWLYVVDRIKELIKVSGNQVAPAELEGFLLGHPAISDCCVIGIPHDYRGEVPKGVSTPSLSLLGADLSTSLHRAIPRCDRRDCQGSLCRVAHHRERQEVCQG